MEAALTEPLVSDNSLAPRADHGPAVAAPRHRPHPGMEGACGHHTRSHRPAGCRHRGRTGRSGWLRRRALWSRRRRFSPGSFLRLTPLQLRLGARLAVGSRRYLHDAITAKVPAAASTASQGGSLRVLLAMRSLHLTPLSLPSRSCRKVFSHQAGLPYLCNPLVHSSHLSDEDLRLLSAEVSPSCEQADENNYEVIKAVCDHGSGE